MLSFAGSMPVPRLKGWRVMYHAYSCRVNTYFSTNGEVWQPKGLLSLLYSWAIYMALWWSRFSTLFCLRAFAE